MFHTPHRCVLFTDSLQVNFIIDKQFRWWRISAVSQNLKLFYKFLLYMHCLQNLLKYFFDQVIPFLFIIACSHLCSWVGDWVDKKWRRSGYGYKFQSDLALYFVRIWLIEGDLIVIQQLYETDEIKILKLATILTVIRVEKRSTNCQHWSSPWGKIPIPTQSPTLKMVSDEWYEAN